jgi:ribonucleotide monophosphatase NagD (HAD superfamily)
MFRAAFAGLAREIAAAGGPRLTRSQVAMVGDQAPQDIAGARRAGLRGILVLSGRTAADEVAGLRGLAMPDAVAASLGDVVAALG